MPLWWVNMSYTNLDPGGLRSVVVWALLRIWKG